MDFRFLKRRKNTHLIVGTLFTGVGIVLLFHLALDIRNTYSLQMPGATQDIPTQTLLLGHSNGRGGPSYRVTYTYKVSQTIFRPWTTEVSREDWEGLNGSSASIPVKYLADKPWISEPDLPDQFHFTVHRDAFYIFLTLVMIPMGYWIALYSKKGQKTKTRAPRREPRFP